MAIEFLNEEISAPTQARGFEFVDEPSAGIEIIGEERPATGKELEARFSNPQYVPSLEEFRTYRDAKAAEPFNFGKFVSTAVDSAAQVAGDIGRGVIGAVSDPLSVPASLLEGAARGTQDLFNLGVKFANRAEKEASERGIVTPAKQEEKIRNEYTNFLTSRALDAQRSEVREGGETLTGLPVNTAVAEAASLVLDPTLIVPAAFPAKTIGRTAAKAAEVAGGITEAGARGVRQLAEIPGRAIESRLDAVKKTPFESVIRAPAAVVEAPFAATAATAATIEGAGQAAKALAEKSAIESQFATLEQIAKDTSKPPWLRKTAGLASRIGIGRALSAAGAAAEGAAQGAAIGGVLGGIAEGSEGAAAGVGSGGVLGAAGGVIARSLGGKKRTAAQEDADMARFVAKQAELGTPVQSLGKLNRETALAAATADGIFGSDLNIRFVNGEEYGRVSRDNLGAAFYSETPNEKPSIFVNLDAMSGQQSNFLHELGHAVFKSPVIDKSQISSSLYSLYGEQGMAKFADDYARKLIENEFRRAGGEKTIPPTAEQITAKKEELAVRDSQWLEGEVFAEQFLDATFDQSLNKIRKGQIPKGASVEDMARASLSAKADVLESMGVPLSPDGSGRIEGGQRGIDRLFEGIKDDQGMREMIRNFIRDRDRFISGVEPIREVSETKGAKVAPKELKNHPAAGWAENPATKQIETDFATLKNGEVELKRSAEIKKVEELRRAELDALIPKNIIPSGNPVLGLKRGADGQVETRGEVLPEPFFTAPSYTDATKALARELMDAIRDGNVFNVWYQAVGTGQGKDSWAQSVRKGLGNLRITNRDVKPLGFFVSKNGNLLVTLLDVSNVFRKALRWQTEGKLNDLWGGDMNAFRADMERYLKNHADGAPGDANGIGTSKRNSLNAFFGVTDKASTGNNPLRSDLRGDDKKSLVKAFRIDRMQSVKPTGGKNFFFDYMKQKRNLKPE